jgi:hypothetical protein
VRTRRREWADHPFSELILHINREANHHGAEIACTQDLYAHENHQTTDKKGK